MLAALGGRASSTEEGEGATRGAVTKGPAKEPPAEKMPFDPSRPAKKAPPEQRIIEPLLHVGSRAQGEDASNRRQIFERKRLEVLL